MSLFLFALISLIVLISPPITGVTITLGLLYFTLLPNVEFGPLAFSQTTIPVFLLTIKSLSILRQTTFRAIAKWQWFLVLGLAATFSLAVVNSSSMSISLLAVPNLLIYLALLFCIPVIVDTPDKLIRLIKISIVMAFILSFWKYELAPIRHLLGISGMGGINGIVFKFHPMVAVCLVIFVVNLELFSRRWKIFAAVTFLSLTLHGIQAETRSAWIAWIFVIVLILLIGPKRRVLTIAVVGIPVVFALLWSYVDIVSQNINEIRLAFTGITEDDIQRMTQDDTIREVGRQAGFAMFRERPWLGWGPNMYVPLKPEFSPFGTLYVQWGSFNSWLTLLAEMGVVTVTVAISTVVIPFIITIMHLLKSKSDLAWLMFGFALGVLALSFHLLFIMEMHSFYWIHVGLVIAAARLAQKNIDVTDSASSHAGARSTHHKFLRAKYKLR